MKKDQLLQKIDRAWQQFNDSYLGLSTEQFQVPGVMGDWSVKDILAHVTTWEEETLQHLPHILQGLPTPRYSDLYGGLDAFNLLMSDRKRGLSLAEVRRQLYETHRKLVEYLQDAPDEQFVKETRFRRRLRLDTYSHYPIHARAIHEWRNQMGL